MCAVGVWVCVRRSVLTGKCVGPLLSINTKRRKGCEVAGWQGN